MSIIRITEGIHLTEIEGSWTVFTDTFDAYAGQFSHFTAANGTVLGEPAPSPKVSDNAYIPVIIPINYEEDLFNSYEVIINNHEEWTFDERIVENLRKQKAHDIRFISNSQIARIKFKAEKGNSTANDSDGGNIKAYYFRFGEKNSFESKIINNIKYGDTFMLEWDKSKNIFQVQFYADDNDYYFDGDVSNVYCGAIKIKGSRVGRRLTSNIEKSPVASTSQQLPWTAEYIFGKPEASFNIANKYQNPQGMCFAITMKRVEKAYLDEWNISDAITVNIKHEDYRYSGTVTHTLDEKYFGYGVGGALAKNGYADLVTTDEIWAGKLEEGAMIQYWNNKKNLSWAELKKIIKNSLRGIPNDAFTGGHSVIFKSNQYDSNGNITSIWYYDYHGISEAQKFDKGVLKILLGANLKDKK